MSRTVVDNGQDILDSRDVIARLEELQEERETLADAVTEAEKEHAANIEQNADQDEIDASEGAQTAAREALTDWDTDNGEELNALKDFIDEGSDEWRHGETLIRETYFEDYARELAEEIGALENCDKWPATCIDWEQAAKELRMDYTGADFDGVTYYYHA